MANEFDLDALLQERSDIEAGAVPMVQVQPDYNSNLGLTGTQKAYDLDAMAAAKQRNVEDSLVGKLGFDPNGIGGEALNLAALGASGISKLAGIAVNLPINAAAAVGQMGVSEEAIQAFNRSKMGEEQAGDAEILAQPLPVDESGIAQTQGERLAGVTGLRDTAESVRNFFDISSIVGTTNRDPFSSDIADNTKQGVEFLRQAGDQISEGNYLDAALSGAAGVVQTVAGGATSVAENKLATVEYAVENLPQLLTAARSVAAGVASNVGYAADELNKGYQDYAAENAGQIPEQADRIKMGAAAASLALAEQVGDLSVLKAARASSKGIGGTIGEVADATVKEGITEGYQTWGEAQTKLKDAKLEDIVEAATIGAAVGGTYTGAGQLAGKANTAASEVEVSKSKRTAVNEAAASGDITGLVDPRSESYNPTAAVGVLHQQAMKADTAPEVVAENLIQADSIEKGLAQQVSDAERTEAIFSESGQAEIASRVDQAEAQLASGDPAIDRAKLEGQLEVLKNFQEQAAARTPEDAAGSQEYLAGLRSQLVSTREAVQRMQVDTSPSADQVQEILSQAQEASPEVAQPAAEKLLTLTMTNPDGMDLKQVRELAASEDTNLSQDQRIALNSFTAAQEALTALKGMSVSTDIQKGGDGYKGLPQYRNAVRVALAYGNTDAAIQQVEQLASFAQSRTEKANAVSAAYDAVKGTDDVVRLVRDATGAWIEAPADMTARGLKNAGGVEVSAKSFKLRDAVALEATALSRAAESLSALVKASPAPVANTAAPVQEAVTAPVEAPVTEEVATPTTGLQTSEPTTEVEATAVTETVAEQEAPATGELTAVREASDIRGKPVSAAAYQGTNLVGAYFAQEASKDDSATQRPLVATPNFATAVRTGTVKVSEFLTEPVSGQQQSAIKRFFGFQRVAQPIVEAGLKLREGKNTELYKFRDYAQFLINPDGSIDENLTTAIAFSAFQWANDTASQLVNTDEGINAILGRDSQDVITPAAYDKLAYIGTRQAVVASQLGGKIAETLGLTLLDNAPSNERSRMEASLGMHAINLLTKAGLAQIKTISDTELQKLMASGVPGAARVKHNFVAPVTRKVDGRTVPSEAASAFKEATIGSQSVLDKLFGSAQNGTEPSFKPVKFDQKYAKRTQQEVPEVLAKILNKEGAKPHYLRPDMWQVWGNLSTDALYEIAGVVSTTDVPTHVYNLKSQEAKNDGLRNQVDLFAQFFGKIGELSVDGIDQALYFGRSVWKPQRVGLTANIINPQTSKVHRHMLRMDSWNVSIPLADQAAMDGFKLRVLEAFGVKTEAKSTAQVLAGYDAKVGSPVIQAAVNALAETLAGEANDVQANEAAIRAGVKAGGEAFHSLDALVALAQEKLARDSGAEAFEVSMMGEVDGVTNGPMLSLLMLGAKDFDTLNQGGFFQGGSEFTQFNDYHGEPGNLDLYESTIDAVLVRLGNDPLLASLEVISGKLTDPEGNVTSKGRKIIKQSLTAMMFGSNTGSAVDGMADGFIATIYEKIQESNTPAELSNILTAVNELIASQNKNPRLQLSSTMDLETALQTTYNPTQEAAIKAAFQSLLGEHVEASLEDTYTVFLARRDVVNQSAGMAYELYQAAFDAKVNEALATADLPRNNAGEAMTGLTKAQVAAIRKELKGMEPVLNTAMSKASEQLDSGMLMAKTKRELNPAYAFGSEVHFGQPVDYIDTDGTVKNVSSLSASGMDTRMDGPGVAPLITGIHSTDSSISHGAIEKHNVLNIHDAHGAAMNDVQGAGQRLNQSTFNNMLNYSVPAEMVATLERTLIGFAGLMNDPVIGSELQAKLKDILAARKTTVSEQLDSIRHVATEADTAKLEMMADMKAVGQYATDGGSYMVSDKDRAAAVTALSKVGSEFNDDALVIADEIDAFATATPVERKPAASVLLSNDSVQTLAPATTLNTFERVKREGNAQLRQDVAAVEQVMIEGNLPLASAKTILPAERAAELVAAVKAASVKRTSVWGEIGVPVNVSDSALVDLLANSEGITARGLAQALKARSTNPFNKKLLQALARLARADLPVILVTADTGPDGAIGEGVSKARGWYASRGNFDATYIKSPDFVESGINEEMLTHELLHTVTGRIIQQALDGKATADVTRLVNELEALRLQAKKAIDSNSSLSTKYANAVSNVHELVSWGMTNTGFQEEVLKGIQVAESAGTNKLLSGLHKFINTLTSLVFSGRAIDQRNGMGLLIANTSGLFAESKRQMDTRNSMTLKYEDAMDETNSMSTKAVFEALADNRPSSAVHTAHMETLIDEIVTNLHGPMGAFRNEVARGQAMTTADAVIKGFNTGRFPFASAALASAFVSNQQEAFVLEQIEATVSESMDSGDGLFIRNALQNLWTESRAKLDAQSFFAGDWSQATQAERDVATEKYNFLFRPNVTVTGRNDYLARFAALGLASEEVSTALGFKTSERERDDSGKPLATRLMDLFRRLLNRLASLHDKTKPGEAANSRLYTLVDRLVDIEAKRRSRVADTKLSLLDQAENFIASGGTKAREAVDTFGQSAIFKSSRSPFVRLTGNVISTVAGERVDMVLDGIQKVRDNAFNAQQGILMGTLTEIRGLHDGNLVADALAKQSREDQRVRKQQIEYTVQMVNAAFENNGEYLTAESKAAISRTLLRSNMAALQSARGFAVMNEAIENPAAMKVIRDELEAAVLELDNGAYFIRMVKDLAYNRVVGGNVNPNLMMNTNNIAKLYGTDKTVLADVKNTVALLDQLQAVYGYEYAPSKAKTAMKEVLRTEAKRGADNGIEMILKLHKGMQVKSKELNFSGNDELMISGYTPDIFDNKIEMESVESAYLAQYEQYGYKYAGDVQADPAVPTDGKRVLVTRRGSGQASILTGAMSYTGMHRKGTNVDREQINMLSDTTGRSDKAIKTIKSAVAAEITDLFSTPINYDPRKAKAQRVAPVVNENGLIVDYRYMMTENNRDALLDRDNSMDQILGTMAGQIVDKVNTNSTNSDVVESMYEQYKEDYNNRPSSYLTVGLDSTDPELKELYMLLPKSTKDKIRKVWKGNNMYIPADQLNMVMGYRKYSLTTPFEVKRQSETLAAAGYKAESVAMEGSLNFVERALVAVAEAVLGKKAALQIGRAEDVIQELVKASKDILVVKNIFTLVGNIVSNTTLLAWYGVSVKDAAKNSAIGIEAAMQYRKDNKRLIQLQTAVEIGYLPNGDVATQDEIAVLRDRMARNPIKPLIDAGLMPTIVEDVEADDSQYSYQSLLQKKVEKYTNKLPKFVRDVGRNVYMTHDTAGYKFLSQTTQLSDLVSRFALYQHLTTRARDPLSQKDALRDIEEAFVNYDNPAHRNLQFMNDMGIVMFTKYYLRIQKVLARLIRTNPARGLALVGLNHAVSGLQSVMDSSWVNKLGGNPFHMGPLNFPSSLGELPVIKGFMKVF